MSIYSKIKGSKAYLSAYVFKHFSKKRCNINHWSLQGKIRAFSNDEIMLINDDDGCDCGIQYDEIGMKIIGINKELNFVDKEVSRITSGSSRRRRSYGKF